MIGHKTVRPHVDSGLTRLLSEQNLVNLLIPVLKKTRLPTIPTLRNVVGKAGNHLPLKRSGLETHDSIAR